MLGLWRRRRCSSVFFGWLLTAYRSTERWRRISETHTASQRHAAARRRMRMHSLLRVWRHAASSVPRRRSAEAVMQRRHKLHICICVVGLWQHVAACMTRRRRGTADLHRRHNLHIPNSQDCQSTDPHSRRRATATSTWLVRAVSYRSSSDLTAPAHILGHNTSITNRQIASWQRAFAIRLNAPSS